MRAWLAERRQRLEGSGGSFAAIDHLAAGQRDSSPALFASKVAEALALARELADPWLELYVRHLEVQGLVNDHADLRGATVAAVSALPLLADPANADCPQAVCCARDLVLLFATADPMGWGDECAAASAELLARVPPRRDCWSCLTSHHISALLNAQRFAEAEAALAEARRVARSARGEAPERSATLLVLEARLAADQGRHAEALPVFERALERADGLPDFASYIRSEIQAALAHAGRWEALALRLREPSLRIQDQLDHHVAHSALAAAGLADPARALRIHLKRLERLRGRDHHYTHAVLAALAAARAGQLDQTEAAAALAAEARITAGRLRRPACVAFCLEPIADL